MCDGRIITHVEYNLTVHYIVNVVRNLIKTSFSAVNKFTLKDKCKLNVGQSVRHAKIRNLYDFTLSGKLIPPSVSKFTYEN